jgi:hypothetical protein
MATPALQTAVLPAATLPWTTRLGVALARARRWEFWPAWLFYIPIVTYIVWLGLRFRRPTLFTAANPMIEAGGVSGEPKAPVLAALAAVEPEFVADFVRLEVPAEAFALARDAVPRLGGYPIVLKPDIGQRGRGVAVIRDEAALTAYLRQAAGAVLLQRYIGGEEYGLFVYRDPRDGRGRLYSITHKCFPGVSGDGRRRLSELILDDARARLISPLLWRRFGERLDEIPAAGTRVPLVEIGAHCRGALFLDASHLATPALLAVVERWFAALPGYGIGRLDLRCPSAEHLQRGEHLRILEINGVTAEAAHIYHPGTPLWQGYAVMLRQWRLAFEIGAVNARRGAAVTGPVELLRRYREDQRRGRLWF